MNHHHPGFILGETGHGTGTTLTGAVFLGRDLPGTGPAGDPLSAPPAAAGGEAPGVPAGIILPDGPEAPGDL